MTSRDIEPSKSFIEKIHFVNSFSLIIHKGFLLELGCLQLCRNKCHKFLRLILEERNLPNYLRMDSHWKVHSQTSGKTLQELWQIRSIFLVFENKSLPNLFGEPNIDFILFLDSFEGFHLLFYLRWLLIEIGNDLWERPSCKWKSNYAEAHHADAEDFLHDCYWTYVSISDRCDCSDCIIKGGNVDVEIRVVLKSIVSNKVFWIFFELSKDQPETGDHMRNEKR